MTNQIFDKKTVSVAIPGPQGPGGEITEVTAEALPTGAEPTVTLGGTPEKREIHLGLPRGGKGDPGDGSVNSVNGDLGPDIVLTAENVGAVPAPENPSTESFLLFDETAGGYTSASFGEGLSFNKSDSKVTVASPNLIDLLPGTAYVAHRGGGAVGLDSSIEAFKQAAAAGFSLEMDLHRLSDGGIAVWHDPTTGAKISGPNTTILNMTTEEWKARKILPERVDGLASSAQGTPCTLDELLDEFGGRTVLWPELKNEDAHSVEAVIDAIRVRNLYGSVIVQTLTWSLATMLVNAGVSVMYRNPTETPQQVAEAGIKYVGLSSTRSPEISDWHSAGVKAAIFTNSKATWRSLLSAQCDAIISDDPWWLSEEPKFGQTLRFDNGRVPGMKAAGGSVSIDIRGNSLEFFQSGGGNEFNSVSLGALGFGGKDVRVGLTVNSYRPMNSPPTESTIMVAVFLGKRPDGGPIRPGQGDEMYVAALVRRDGRMQLENKPSYAAPVSSLGSSPADPNAEPGKPTGPMEFEFLFEAGKVTVRNKTRWIDFSQSFPDWAESPEDLYLTVHVRGNNSNITDIWSQLRV